MNPITIIYTYIYIYIYIQPRLNRINLLYIVPGVFPKIKCKNIQGKEKGKSRTITQIITLNMMYVKNFFCKF
jgi:hypothetical protein